MWIAAISGRTMEFTFDMSQVNVIGRKQLDMGRRSDDNRERPELILNQDKDGASSLGATEAPGPPGWKTPHLSQV